MPADWFLDAWTHPDSATFERVAFLDALAGTTLSDTADRVGSGQVNVPADQANLDALFDVDPTTGAGVAGLVCLWRPGQTVPDSEWLVEEDVANVDDTNPSRSLLVREIRAALDDAIVGPDPLSGRDWIWAGRNILPTTLVDVGEVVELWLTGTSGGTFTIGNGTDTTAALDWDATAGEVETAIESAMGYSDVRVTGTGDEDDPWRVEYVNPAGDVPDLFINGGSLTGTDPEAFVNVVSQGGSQPDGWGVSEALDRGVGYTYGRHASGSPSVDFGAVDSAEGATWSYTFNGINQFAGVQTVVPVDPGSLWQFRTRLNASSGSDLWRIVIRPLYEDPHIAASDPWGGFTLSAGVWTEVTIDDIVIPEGVDQVIVRIAYVGTGNPSPLYINLETGTRLSEGRAATAAGNVLYDLVEDAKLRGVLEWLDTAGLDGAVDEAGDPWDSTDLSFRADVGMSLATHVAADLESMGYEWDIVRKATPVGALTHDLRVWNPGGRGADLDGSGAGFVEGLNVEAGASTVARRRPPRTHLLVETDDFTYTDFQTDAALAGWPRREGFLRALWSADVATAEAAAAAAFADDLSNLYALRVQAFGDPDAYVGYDVGTTVRAQVGPGAAHDRRVSEITLRLDEDGWTRQVVCSRVFEATEAGQTTALWEAVRRLYAEFARRRRPRPSSTLVGGQGGAPTVVVAAANATDLSKSKADLVAGRDGSATDVIVDALAICSQGGRVLLTEGTFSVTRGRLVIPSYVMLAGVGWATNIELSGDTTAAGIVVGNYAELCDLRVGESFN